MNMLKCGWCNGIDISIEAVALETVDLPKTEEKAKCINIIVDHFSFKCGDCGHIWYKNMEPS